VTVIWGEDDPWIPLERGQALARAAGTTLRPLPGLGHLPQLEDPPAVTAALQPALAA
jgi:pimeloyl-ACP methyl ester carboxylesterase